MIIVSVLSFLGIISTEPLTWRLIKVWLPVNVIFVGMLITSMFRYDVFICFMFFIRFWGALYYISKHLKFNFSTHSFFPVLSSYSYLFGFFHSLKYINVAMVTVLKNVTNVITALGEMYLFSKHHESRVWAALFLMVCS